MKKTFKRYQFASGMVIICKGMSAHELKCEENRYGKVVSITITY